ncbi:hypothetical protein ANCCAN_26061, partial [Ancylostoma caninum]
MDAENDTKPTTNGWFYHIHHARTWKGPIVATSILSTPNSECGITSLLQGWEYFVTGKKGKDGEITFTTCDFVMPSDQLTPEEHVLLLELMYHPEKC